MKDDRDDKWEDVWDDSIRIDRSHDNTYNVTNNYTNNNYTNNSTGNQNSPEVALVIRAQILMEDGDFNLAKDLLEQALNHNPMYAQAYFTKLLAEHSISTVDELLNVDIDLSSDKLFKRALQFADNDYAAELHRILSANKEYYDKLRAIEKEKHDKLCALENRRKAKFIEVNRKYKCCDPGVFIFAEFDEKEKLHIYDTYTCNYYQDQFNEFLVAHGLSPMNSKEIKNWSVFHPEDHHEVYDNLELCLLYYKGINWGSVDANGNLELYDERIITEYYDTLCEYLKGINEFRPLNIDMTLTKEELYKYMYPVSEDAELTVNNIKIASIMDGKFVIHTEDGITKYYNMLCDFIDNMGLPISKSKDELLKFLEVSDDNYSDLFE